MIDCCNKQCINTVCTSNLTKALLRCKVVALSTEKDICVLADASATLADLSVDVPSTVMARCGRFAIAGLVVCLCILRLTGASPYINNGRTLAPNCMPWLAAVLSSVNSTASDGNNLTFVCGGALFMPSRVITAAHCVLDSLHLIGSGHLWVRVNSTVWNLGGQLLLVASADVHPDFNVTRNVSKNDLAILHLVVPSTAPPISLISSVQAPKLEANGTAVVFAGWGNTGASVARLQQPTPRYTDITFFARVANLSVYDVVDCQRLLESFPWPVHWHHTAAALPWDLCAFDVTHTQPAQKETACYGDR